MRQVRNRLVIRLEKELRDADIALLNDKFQDLIKLGKIHQIHALPEESDEPKLLAKPRIAFNYNRRSAGRLNEMILKINKLGGVILPEDRIN